MTHHARDGELQSKIIDSPCITEVCLLVVDCSRRGRRREPEASLQATISSSSYSSSSSSNVSSTLWTTIHFTALVRWTFSIADILFHCAGCRWDSRKAEKWNSNTGQAQANEDQY